MSARKVAALWVIHGRGYRIDHDDDAQALMRLAELGAKALEILAERHFDAEETCRIVEKGNGCGGDEIVYQTVATARSLGLLGDGPGEVSR